MIGPILMGPSRPVHVLQRGSSVSDVVNLAALAAIEAQDASRYSHGAEKRLMHRMLSGQASPKARKRKK